MVYRASIFSNSPSLGIRLGVRVRPAKRLEFFPLMVCPESHPGIIGIDYHITSLISPSRLPGILAMDQLFPGCE